MRETGFYTSDVADFLTTYIADLLSTYMELTNVSKGYKTIGVK